MLKQFKLVAGLLLLSSAVMAQSNKPVTETEEEQVVTQTEGSFTFTEAQLGEDDDATQNVSIIGSGSNLYASEVGYLFSPLRFRYRALNQKYNEVYVNGLQLNDMERGQFTFSNVGGLNQQTKGAEFALPFEANNFAVSGYAGSNNYNFRSVAQAAGHRLTLTGANRNYNIRGMYTYGTGILPSGWSLSANVTYRGSKEGYIEGTFYNSLSYFLGVSKLINGGQHTLSLSTWGNPTERASQGASTDEMYWLANNRYYNPYWGYQDGKKRNSRIVNDFAPSAIFTWDWKISDNAKLTTSAFGKYSMYKSTKLNYNNADNPHPNYYKLLPSANYDVWNGTGTDADVLAWQEAYDFLTACKANRQINWDRLYESNRGTNEAGTDAMYYIQARHNDQLHLAASTALNMMLKNNMTWNIGLNAAASNNRHYQTMEDLLGANMFHNVNTYAIGTYTPDSKEVQYDLNNPNAVVKEGDKFGYDYSINVRKANAWTNFSQTTCCLTYNIAARLGGTTMQREGFMRNGLAENNSYGKSRTAKFVDGGVKFGTTLKPLPKFTVSLGLGYEQKAPLASAAFISPEIINDFVADLKNEKVFSSEIGLNYSGSLLKLNLTGYYYKMKDVTEWQNFYFDDINSFSYVSLTGIQKEAYGLEAGARVRLTTALDLKLMGTISEAQYVNNANVLYMNSTKADISEDVCYNKGMRESGTPLTATSIGLSYHQSGWFIDLNANWYDRIYLSYSPNYRYGSVLEARQAASQNVFDNYHNLLEEAVAQAKGHGGWMLDASVGRSIYLKKGSLSINLSLTNILNNQNIVTGGYEQSRSNHKQNTDGTFSSTRTYNFAKNPMKFYAYGVNGMLNIAYKF